MGAVGRAVGVGAQLVKQGADIVHDLDRWAFRSSRRRCRPRPGIWRQARDEWRCSGA
jgi:hypothetical protein